MQKSTFAFGVDIGGTNISVGLVTSQGKLSRFTSLPSKALRGGPALIKRVEQLLKRIISSSHIDRNRIIGIGVGCPGSINFDQGISQAMTPHIPQWRGLNIRKRLEQAFKIPVFVENDVNAMAWGEKTWGAGQGVNNIVCLTLGTGIGGAIILDGKLYRGPHYYAGEIGHMKIGTDGPRCDCGAYGCLESFFSGPAIVRDFIKAVKGKPRHSLVLKQVKNRLDKIKAKMIFKAAWKNDYLARQVVNRAIHYLGRALASIINIFDCELVILGGRIASDGELLLRPLRRIVKTNIMPSPVRQYRIVTSQLGEKAGLFGAAALVFHTLQA